MEKNRISFRTRSGDPGCIVSTDEAQHARHRRGITGAFTEHAIREHASLVESYVRLMVENFKQSITAGQGLAIVDMVDRSNFLTFDASGALAFGESFDCVKEWRAHPWVDI